MGKFNKRTGLMIKPQQSISTNKPEINNLKHNGNCIIYNSNKIYSVTGNKWSKKICKFYAWHILKLYSKTKKTLINGEI